MGLALVVGASLVGSGLIGWLGPERLPGLLHLAADRAPLLLGLFAVWAMVANMLVLPAGSLSLIAGGAALGSLLPAAIWFLAQLVTSPLLYRASATDHARVLGLVDKYAGRIAAGCLDRAARDGVWTTILLRLTPVLPSAPAGLIASASGIGLKQFIIGSVLAGWVRPLYFGSIGAGLGSLARLGAGDAKLAWDQVLPLLVVFVVAAATVVVRQWGAAEKLKVAAHATSAPGD